MASTRFALIAGAILIVIAGTPPAAKVLRFARLWDGSRLIEKAVVVIEGDSYRNPPTTKRRKSNGAQAEAR